jgi:hypothetical protein
VACAAGGMSGQVISQDDPAPVPVAIAREW